MTGKLTHWAKLLVGCTLGLTVIFVSLRLWDKIHIVILFPEDLLLHHIPTLFIKPSVSVLNLPPPAPPVRPRLPSCPSVFVLLVSSQSHPACSKLSSTLHPSSPYRCSIKKKKKTRQSQNVCWLRFNVCNPLYSIIFPEKGGVVFDLRT